MRSPVDAFCATSRPARASRGKVTVGRSSIRRSSAPTSLGVHVAEPLLMSVTRISTFAGDRLLTAGSGFFFERKPKLFLVTSRHVFIDEPGRHLPDRIEFVVHTDPKNLTQWRSISMPLYVDGKAAWRQASDSGGEVDVAAIEVPKSLLPPALNVSCFGPESLLANLEIAEVGTPLL